MPLTLTDNELPTRIDQPAYSIGFTWQHGQAMSGHGNLICVYPDLDGYPCTLTPAHMPGIQQLAAERIRRSLKLLPAAPITITITSIYRWETN